jgi:hypothetical protein
MPHMKRFIYAISLLTVVGAAPAAALAGSAGPVDVSTMDSTALRALFHGPDFSRVDPMVIYGEDYTDAATALPSTPMPAAAHDPADSARTTAAVHDMLRDPAVGSPDGLDDYVRADARAEPSQRAELTR